MRYAYRVMFARADPCVPLQSYLALGGGSGGGLCSAAANVGGSNSTEALTPRLMGYGSSSALYLGSANALPGLSPAEPPSPGRWKPGAGGASADTNARS